MWPTCDNSNIIAIGCNYKGGLVKIVS